MKGFKIVLTVLMMVSVIGLGIVEGSEKPATTPSTGKLPHLVGLVTYASGSAGYATFSGMGLAITEKTGIKVKVVPAGSDKGRVIPLINGEALFSGVAWPDLLSAAAGKWNWQPEGAQMDKFVMAWNGEPATTCLITRANSGIKTVADLKGKRVADTTKTDPGSMNRVEAYLAYGGLTLKDVISVPCAPYPVTVKVVISGAADAGGTSPSAKDALALGTSIYGARLLEMPPDDAAWARARKIAPYVTPNKTTRGVTAGKETPRWVSGHPYIIACRPDADEYTIYRSIKAIIEGYNIYKGVSTMASYWDLEAALNLNYLNGVGIPYHPGAIRAFKETGKWTAAHDKWQQSRVDFIKKARALWDATVAQAKKEKISVGTPSFVKIWEPKWSEVYATLATTDK